MNLEIAGRSAIVCGSSRGLGRACAEALAAEGVHVVLNGRGQSSLDEAAAEMRQRHSVNVHAVLGDVTTQEGRIALLEACPEPDILINNNAGPSPGPFVSWTHDDWMRALAGNMVAALMLTGSVVEGMVDRGFGRIVNITSKMVKAPHPTMSLSSGARAGLTAAVKGLSSDVASKNVTINNLLPGHFDTDRQQFMAERMMERDGVSYEEARRRQAKAIAANRLGRPAEFGAMCAFLCSEHAAFTTGNNILLDGGTYAGVF
jgi:3-oxoacyl-[acyl-carrier protein] reductase